MKKLERLSRLHSKRSSTVGTGKVVVATSLPLGRCCRPKTGGAAAKRLTRKGDSEAGISEPSSRYPAAVSVRRASRQQCRVIHNIIANPLLRCIYIDSSEHDY